MCSTFPRFLARMLAVIWLPRMTNYFCLKFVSKRISHDVSWETGRRVKVFSFRDEPTGLFFIYFLWHSIHHFSMFLRNSHITNWIGKFYLTQIQLSLQIFHVWINHHCWPTATTPHQRISITCHSCKCTAHQWWVRECRHIYGRELKPQWWKTIKTCKASTQWRGKICCL